jgi:PAS domain-containing protein
VDTINAIVKRNGRSPGENAGQTVGNEGEIKNKQDADAPRANTRVEQAEARTEQAVGRTEQAVGRKEQAEARTEQAEARSEQAETRSEQAIRASELSYRRLFEAAKDGILILDADTGRISDANPFLIELLGFLLAK